MRKASALNEVAVVGFRRTKKIASHLDQLNKASDHMFIDLGLGLV